MRLTIHAAILFFCLATPTFAQLNETNQTVRPITLDESVQLALRQNLNLQIARYNTRIAGAQLRGAYSYYDPEFRTDYSYNFIAREGRIDPTTGLQLRPGETKFDQMSAGFIGATPWGLRYDLGMDVTYNSRFDPSLGGLGRSREYQVDAGIALTQPLLRDFMIDAGRAQILLNRKTMQINEHLLEQRIMQTVRDVSLAYYDLSAARDFVRAAEKALERARRLVVENRRRVEVGTMAPLDEKQAESEEALRQADLIAAQREVSFRENILKNLITDHYEKWFNDSLHPSEPLVAIPQEFSRNASWLSGVTLRPDYKQLQAQVERQGIQVRLARNAQLPALDLTGSYGRSGIDRGFSSALGEVKDERLPRYSGGVIFSIPLFNRGAKADYESARLQREQLIAQLQQFHQQIMVELADAMTEAQSALQRVAATRKAREFSEAALSAEERKLESGRSTSFNVLQFQRDLTEAQAQEIRALADYNNALTVLYYNEGTILQRNKLDVTYR